MPRILSISSSRADVGVLRPVWRALAERRDVEQHVLLTGMHRIAEAQAPELPPAAVVHVGGEDLGGSSEDAAARGMVACATATAEVIAQISPDCLLVTGDRMDMFPAVFAAVPYNVPVAHLHGGELTYGAVDDRIRHAITKLAHLHFVSCAEAAERVLRMGEEPWRVHVTGGPGIDSLCQAPTMAADAFADRLDLPFAEGFVLVTVHPETNADEPDAPLRAALRALDQCATAALITAPNSDPGGRQLRTMIDAFVMDRRRVAFRDTLGTDLYANALRHAAAMLGNSSSGLIEAGVFGLPVVNVGRRQDGRTAGPNVAHVPSDATAILAALEPILSDRNRYPSYSPYGDGLAGERIASVLASPPDRHQLLYKTFFAGDERSETVAPWDRPARSATSIR